MRTDLVLEGGGVKGIALTGAYAALFEAGYRPYRMAGTSAGAITGALIAAGYTPSELHEVMSSLDYRQFRQKTVFDHAGRLGELLSLLVTEGVYKGDAVRDWVAEMLAARGVETFADLRLDDPGEGEQPYNLVVMTSDVSRGELVRLPWDYPRYGLDPDRQHVADAVRCSMSIPFYFQPVKLAWHDGGRQVDSYLVDGGMLSNFPVEVFDRPGQEPRWPTFGIMLTSRRKALAKIHNDVHDVVSLTKALIATATGFYDQMHIDEPSVVHRTMFVDTFGVSAVDFDLDRALQDRLYLSGYDTAQRFLKEWTFEGYREAAALN